MDQWCGVQKIEEYWPAISDRVSTVCMRSKGRLTPEYIKAELIFRRMHLWLAHKDGKITAIIIAKPCYYQKSKWYRIVIATGTGFREWLSHISILEEWAKANGFDGIEAEAREGWFRFLKKFGWTKPHIFLEKGF